MAVTQYIGARYVPVFADPSEWDNTRTYEPLTIVLHNGASYTSAQYVPVGIDILNTEFWQCTGNYNAQVEKYREEVNAFDERITANADAITAETSRASAAEKVNADAITAETSRAEAAEKVNADAITEETSRASAAEKVNADAITAETSRASAAENELSADIDSIKCYKNALSFGVSPNNADNADVFQSALNTCTENGWILYIPNGTYKMSHSISLPWNCNIEGQSETGTILKFESNSGLVGDLTDVNGYKTVVGCVLKNFTIRGSYEGFHTRIWNQPWYSEAYNHEYMALNYAGLGGWFTVSNIQGIAIDHFVCGLVTFQPAFQGNDFNGKYNNVYGDLRIFRDISVCYTNTGIRMCQSDTFLNGFDVSHCYEMEPVFLTDCVAENGHTWAQDRGWYVSGKSRIVNMEVEAQECYHTIESDSKTQFDGMLVINANSPYGGVRIINATFWNILNLADGGVMHNIIRCADTTTQPIQIYGATFGSNPTLDSTLDSSIYPTRLFRTSDNAAAPKSILFGSIAEQFTSIMNATSTDKIYSGAGPILLCVTAAPGSWPKGVSSSFTGGNTISYTSI